MSARNYRGANRWTPEIEDLLCDLYGRYKSEVVARRLNAVFGTTFTRDAVRCRACRLGIDTYSNQGHLTVSEAARQLGIGDTTLHHYLKANKVPVIRSGPWVYVTDEQFAALAAHYAPPPEPSIPAVEAARALRCSLNNVHRLVAAGKLRAYRVGVKTLIAIATIEERKRAKALRALAARAAERKPA